MSQIPIFADEAGFLQFLARRNPVFLSLKIRLFGIFKYLIHLIRVDFMVFFASNFHAIFLTASLKQRSKSEKSKFPSH